MFELSTVDEAMGAPLEPAAWREVREVPADERCVELVQPWNVLLVREGKRRRFWMDSPF